MATQARLCESCQQVQPASKFLPSSLSPTGYLTKCLDCIRKTAEQHRLERARIANADLAPATQAIDLASVRPVSQRISRELYEAAKRFVLDFRDGHTKPIQGEMEPELYELLEWLAQQSMFEPENRRTPEEVGRAILGYRDNNTSRGVAYGALWAALVRAKSVYGGADDKAIDNLARARRSNQRRRA